MKKCFEKAFPSPNGAGGVSVVQKKKKQKTRAVSFLGGETAGPGGAGGGHFSGPQPAKRWSPPILLQFFFNWGETTPVVFLENRPQGGGGPGPRAGKKNKGGDQLGRPKKKILYRREKTTGPRGGGRLSLTLGGKQKPNRSRPFQTGKKRSLSKQRLGFSPYTQKSVGVFVFIKGGGGGTSRRIFSPGAGMWTNGGGGRFSAGGDARGPYSASPWDPPPKSKPPRPRGGRVFFFFFFSFSSAHRSIWVFGNQIGPTEVLGFNRMWRAKGKRLQGGPRFPRKRGPATEGGWGGGGPWVLGTVFRHWRGRR